MYYHKYPDKAAPIVVVGCGVFGLSTILELLKQGYTTVLGLDVASIPSPRAAATDYNKMLRVEYANIMYAKLSVEALGLWENDPLFQPYYHKNGRLVLSPYQEKNKCRLVFDKLGAENIQKLGCHQRIIELNSSKEVGDEIPQFGHNTMPDPLVARYNLDSAYGESSASLVGVYEECVKRGARFIFGEGGRVTKVKSDGSVHTAKGNSWRGEKVFICAGAYTPMLVDARDIVTAVGHFVSHVKLTDEQYLKYKEMPTFFSAEYGYFFPPDPKDHVLKVGHTYGDARYWTKNPFDPKQTISSPYYIDDAPGVVIEATRTLMNLVIPELADNPIINCKIGWTSVAYDANFLIDYVPDSTNVIACTGDSAHAYKFLPNIGKYIVQRMEGTLSSDYAEAWKYRRGDWTPKDVSERTPRQLFDITEIDDWVNGSAPVNAQASADSPLP